MMFGAVNNDCEAIIKVAVGGIGSPKIAVDAVIDTEFTSFLSLPLSIIAELDLTWHYRDVGTLGDGSEMVFELYKASVIWDGFKLQVEAVEGGRVTVEAMR